MTPAQEEVIRLVTMRFWDTESQHIKRLHPALGFTAWCGVHFCVEVTKMSDTYAILSCKFCKSLENFAELCYDRRCDVVSNCIQVEKAIIGGKPCPLDTINYGLS